MNGHGEPIVSVDIDGTLADYHGQRIVLHLDRTLLQVIAGAWVSSVDLSAAGAGEHTISLRAFDNSNNVGNISLTFRR